MLINEYQMKLVSKLISMYSSLHTEISEEYSEKTYTACKCLQIRCSFRTQTKYMYILFILKLGMLNFCYHTHIMNIPIFSFALGDDKYTYCSERCMTLTETND
jgi:hypothetical protein